MRPGDADYAIIARISAGEANTMQLSYLMLTKTGVAAGLFPAEPCVNECKSMRMRTTGGHTVYETDSR